MDTRKSSEILPSLNRSVLSVAKDLVIAKTWTRRDAQGDRKPQVLDPANRLGDFGKVPGQEYSGAYLPKGAAKW